MQYMEAMLEIPKEIISWPVGSLIVLALLKAFSKINLPIQR